MGAQHFSDKCNIAFYIDNLFLRVPQKIPGGVSSRTEARGGGGGAQQFTIRQLVTIDRWGRALRYMGTHLSFCEPCYSRNLK